MPVTQLFPPICRLKKRIFLFHFNVWQNSLQIKKREREYSRGLDTRCCCLHSPLSDALTCAFERLLMTWGLFSWACTEAWSPDGRQHQELAPWGRGRVEEAIPSYPLVLPQWTDSGQLCLELNKPANSQKQKKSHLSFKVLTMENAIIFINSRHIQHLLHCFVVSLKAKGWLWIFLCIIGAFCFIHFAGGVNPLYHLTESLLNSNMISTLTYILTSTLNISCL